MTYRPGGGQTENSARAAAAAVGRVAIKIAVAGLYEAGFGIGAVAVDVVRIHRAETVQRGQRAGGGDLEQGAGAVCAAASVVP